MNRRTTRGLLCGTLGLLLVFAAFPLSAATVTFPLAPFTDDADPIPVFVTLTDTATDTIEVRLFLNDVLNEGWIGDEIGLFINFLSPISGYANDQITVTGIPASNVFYDTDRAGSSNNQIANNLNFDLALRLGNQGAGDGIVTDQIVTIIAAGLDITQVAAVGARVQSIECPAGVACSGSAKLLEDNIPPPGGTEPEIPEPSTYLLGGSALVGLALYRKRRS